MKVTELVAQFAKPVVEENGCELWDVEYVREGSDYFLRLYLDKEGGVDFNDCERISRAMDPILDEKDPIPTSYHFEVCSAGLERTLKRPSDFQQFMGSTITVKLYRPRNGLKEIPCVLTGYEDGKLTVTAGKETITFEKSEVALVRLRRPMSIAVSAFGSLFHASRITCFAFSRSLSQISRATLHAPTGSPRRAAISMAAAPSRTLP